MNYLPDAVAHGAEVFTEVTVRSVGPADGTGWRVACRPTRGRPGRGGERSFDATIVVLAAGTLGSTELLLLSRARGLTLSTQLGRRISGNGDFPAFAYDCDERIDGIGRGSRVDAAGPVGPSITAAVDLRTARSPREGLVIQEGAIPSPLAPLLPLGMLLAAAKAARRAGVVPEPRRVWRRLHSLAVDRPRGSMARTLTLLAMGTDDRCGQLTLAGDRPLVSWPGAAASPHPQGRLAPTVVAWQARPGPPGAATAERSTTMSTRFFNRNIDQELHDKMVAFTSAGADITWLAFPPGGADRWSVVTNQERSSTATSPTSATRR